MTEIEIAQKVLCDKKQVVAVIVSNWHLAGALSFVHALRKQGEYEGGTLIAVLPHPTSGYIVAEESMPELLVEVVHCSPSQQLAKNVGSIVYGWVGYCLSAILNSLLHKSESKIYFLSVMQPHMRNLLPLLVRPFSLRLIQLNLIDEGTGTYMPSSYWDRVNADEFQAQGGIRRYLAIFVKRLALLPFCRPQSLFLFRKVSGQLKLDKEVAMRYRSFFNEVYWKACGRVGKQFEVIGGGVTGSVCLYLSQPVVELGLVTEAEYCKIIQRLSAYCNRHGYHLLFKPHPRESFDCNILGVTVIGSDHIAEAIVAILNPKMVIGLTSSALVTIPCLFDIPSISLMKVFNEICSKDVTLYNQFAYFEMMFNKYVTFVDEVDDILVT